ncbi:MAG: alpha/beta fold hydrolase [Phycisphaerales bacterium]|nr:alpha/beta fold hydrolase [Phycisphaerales bacterium]
MSGRGLIASVIGGMIALASSVTAAPPSITLERAVDPETGTEIRFGALRVYENRDAAAGRKIDLAVVVLPATGPDPRPDPLFVLAGGPGLGAAANYRGHLQSPFRRDRDIVLVSQRGTRGSANLECVVPGDDDDLQSYLDPLFDPDVFRACLETLETKADLRMYSTPIAMDDLDDVRAALGYEQINLWGGSYGTRAALVYLRRHGAHARTAILNGVAPIAFTNPLFHARSAQRAVELVFEECAADPECHDVFPMLPQEFEAVLARLADRDALVTVTHPATGVREQVALSRKAFESGLRFIMYLNSREVPLLIHQAFLGDHAPFAQRAIERARSLRGAVSFGMLLCVTCAEDVDRIDPAAIARATDGTYIGPERVLRQKELCSFWPRSILPANYGEPVRSTVPVLLLSGTLDPVTPPRWGEEAARHLPNARHLVVPGAHGVGGPCLTRISLAFLEQGSVDDLDTSCVEDVTLGRFRLPPR